MQEWWESLTTLNQCFYVAAAFFSVFFVWQLIAALIGLSGGEDADAADAHGLDHGTDVGSHEFHHGAHSDAADTMAAFRLLSVRSILAFCTLFTWAGAMYLQNDKPIAWALLYALLWGGAAMVIVASILHFMRRMTETGTMRLASCVGSEGMVYLNIPAGGVGEARVTVSGTVQNLKARGAGGSALSAGTPIVVTRLLAADTIEVRPVTASSSESGKE
jgi:hypothetical protein